MSNPPFRILIVDDEADARAMIRLLLERYYEGTFSVEEAKGVQEALEKTKSFQPELVFLDVKMGDGSGFDFLDQWGRLPDFNLVFTTSFDEYALKAFKYCAMDYLLKPIDPDDFQQALQKAKKRQEEEQMHNLLRMIQQPAKKRHFDKIALPSAEGIIMIDLKKILHLESDKGYTTFHMLNGKKYTIAKLIGDYEEILPASSFYRIHVSHIVNIEYVEKVLKLDGGMVLMEGGGQLPIARRRKDGFLERLKALQCV